VGLAGPEWNYLPASRRLKKSSKLPLDPLGDPALLACLATDVCFCAAAPPLVATPYGGSEEPYAGSEVVAASDAVGAAAGSAKCFL
jgi:hypothetical protein